MRDRDRIVSLADHLLTSVRPFASDDHALITMPGPVGGRGARVDGLEGFARTFMLAAFRITGAPDEQESIELADWYARGIIAGVDPDSPSAWIRPAEASQARVEIASIALGLDLTRPQIWGRLPAQTQKHLIDYMAEVVGNDDYPPNNWLWFRIVTETFLRSVGGPWSIDDLRQDLAFFDSLAQADGWYSDGQGRKYDHYIGWAMSLYPTLWARMRGAEQIIDEIDPGRLGRDRRNLNRYLQDAVRLVGADGSPLIQGRSLIYRFAAAAPFWVGAMAGIEGVPLGTLRQAAMQIVEHFEANGVPDPEGILNLGWHHEWPLMSQSYSGPSSPYWASKGLLGIALPADHPIWAAPKSSLPSATEDYQFDIAAPGWIVSSTRADGICRVINHGTDNAQMGSKLADSPLYARLAYSTATCPLLRETDWANPADQSVSLIDNDGRGSHRTGMIYLGSSGPGTASSLNLLHWVSPDSEQDGFGGGLTGDSEEAGIAVIHSVVRAGSEVRLVRLINAASSATTLRVSGWPITGSVVESSVRPEAITLKNDSGLQATISTPSEDVILNTMTVRDANFLGPETAYAYADFSVVPGADHLTAITLTGEPQPGSGDKNIEVTTNRSRSGVLDINVTWEDGSRSTHSFFTMAEKLEIARDNALAILRSTIDKFGADYPDDCTIDLRYPPRLDDDGQNPGGNFGWTTGFWVGSAALAQQLSGDSSFMSQLEAHLDSFTARLDHRIEIDHHDMGFLYTLAGTLPYYLTGDSRLREMTLRSADVLMERYLEPAGIIQAWGDLDDPKQRGRAIIDSLMNLPLLYWATAETNDERYAVAAHRHAHRLAETIIREDDTTHHTYHFDPSTGEALHGSTAQGAADESTWARGQAWGIYGFTLSYRYTGDEALLQTAARCADRYLEMLPADRVPFWDMIYTDYDDEPRDSSSAAIAACGLLDLADALAQSGHETKADKYRVAALEMLESLIDNYATLPGEADALLAHSVYSKPDDRGVDEGSVWGDYFYLEALARVLVPSLINPWAPDPRADGPGE